MMDRRLESELARVADRCRQLRLFTGWSLCWVMVAVSAIVFLLAGWATESDLRSAAVVAIGLGLIAAGIVFVTTRRDSRNLLTAARQVEHQFPDLDQRLLAAMEQQAGWPIGQFGYLQELVVREAVEHSLRNEWRQTVSANRLARARRIHSAAVALMACALLVAFAFAPAAPLAGNLVAKRSSSADHQVVVEPGNTSIERGTDLLVMARFPGPLPADVHIVFETAPGKSNRLPLAKSLNDPLFGGRIPSVATDLTYHVEFDGNYSPDYRVTVFEYPDVMRVDAEVAFPSYTGLETQRIEDTRHVSALEGSTITLICQLNKPVERAWLATAAGQTIELSGGSNSSNDRRVSLPLAKTERYTVHVVDSDGRANKFPPEVTLTALPNRPPELTLKFPGRDVQASPLEEVSLHAVAWDDFGLKSYGMTFMPATQPTQSFTLGASVPAKEKRDVQHTIFLEDLKAQPDQLLSYYFWAEDLGPDGKPRRTSGDMFFIEVRPFEEIFRQGEQPTESEMRQQQQQQNQGGAAQQAAQLAELQKQIINATWKLIRRSDAKPVELAKDATMIRDSQASALEQVDKLAEQARSPDAATAIQEIERQMKVAIDYLSKAADGPTPEPLEPALASEQAAYQALLKLRAREHRVVRGRMAQRGGGGNSSNRADRQLSELELDSRENRYENRRAPTPAEQETAREDNQVLNRLRELARRQEDVNKRIQELQSQLQAARDESKREELRRQLERLREEQQEMLRDLDKLRNRMDSPENQQRMAEARERLEQTRQNMRQASESLRQEQLAPALNSGTRAERELEQVRDEFRRRTANQFSDEMRSMRDDARELSRREQELGDRLEQLNNAQRPTLRDTERTDIVEQMGEQRKRLGELTESMKTVSEAAETSEPLLSKQLYDTLRDTAQRNADRSMEITSELLRRGFVPQAGEVEQKVRQDVDALRKGVERAANSVLGDPAEATRRALEEVEDLTRQLQQEVAQADPAGERPNSQQAARDEQAGRQRAQPSDQKGGEPSQSSQQSSQQPSQQSQQSDRGRSKTGRGQQGQDSVNQSPESGQQPEEPGNRRANSAEAKKASAGRRSDQAGPGQPASGQRGGDDRNLDLAGWGGPGGPITGERFREWSDRLREVEEMLENPDLRAEVAEINDRARDVRRDLKRHSKEPSWPMVRRLIAEPMVELQMKLREELARQESSDKLVPIDRDPVPRRYSDLVREYYERLGSGK